MACPDYGRADWHTCNIGRGRGGKLLLEMTHGSLFSGIGGFDLAAEWMGWDNLFHCEWNPFGQKILNYYWPKAISYNDITQTDFTIWNGRIDVLTGGFPCQPYSQAGKRLGTDDERHLWPEMLRAIREIQPKWVVGENVLGLINWNEGLVFDEVQADLEAEGYEVQPYVLPACAVNAPHRRDRIWFVAYAENGGCRGRESEQRSVREWKLLSGELKGGSVGCETSGCSREQSTPDTDIKRDGFCKKERKRRGIAKGENKQSTPDTRSIRPQQSRPDGELVGDIGFSERNAHSFRRGIWQNFPTQPPICGGDDGLPAELDGITFSKWRAESIKAYGNAIVPQVAYQIFKSINQYESK
jgi:DNA (cytosine-5)-methyltransferase 1